MINLLRRCAVIAGVCTSAPPLAAQEPAPTPDGVYELAQVEVRPVALNAEALGAAMYARYPPRLRAAGVSGTATVSLVVGVYGVPLHMRVVSSSDSAFDAPTLEAVSLLRFSPARVAGRAVAVQLELPVGWETRTEPPRPDSTGAYEFDQVETVPRPRNIRRYRSALKRLYPPPLRAARVAGEVNVRVRVAADGTVTHAHVTDTTDDRFDEATIAAVRELRFAPATLGGRPVPVWVEMPVSWGIR